MEIKGFDVFSSEEWPKARLNAEMKAAIKGYDTLLCLNESGKFSGRSKSGVWCVGITPEYHQIANFINYENNHNRKIIIWSENKELALQLLKKIDQLDIKTHMKLDNTKFLCHSTSLESFHYILWITNR